MNYKLKSALEYMVVYKMMTLVIILVLSLIFVLQTYIIENDSESFRYILSEPVLFHVENFSFDNMDELQEYNMLHSDFDVACLSYIDCNYEDEFGEHSEFEIFTYLNDFSNNTKNVYINEELNDYLLSGDNLLVFPETFSVFESNPLFVSHNDSLIWSYGNNNYEIDSCRTGLDFYFQHTKTTATIFASNETYNKIASDVGIDDLYVCFSSDVNLKTLIDVALFLKCNCDCSFSVVFSSGFSRYFGSVIKSCLIIFIGLYSMIQIICFILNGRKSEFKTLVLCGISHRRIWEYKLVNIFLYALPSVTLGFAIFKLLSFFVWTSEDKFYSLSSWQLLIDVLLYLLFVGISFFVYELRNYKSGEIL